MIDNHDGQKDKRHDKHDSKRQMARGPVVDRDAGSRPQDGGKQLRIEADHAEEDSEEDRVEGRQKRSTPPPLPHEDAHRQDRDNREERHNEKERKRDIVVPEPSKDCAERDKEHGKKCGEGPQDPGRAPRPLGE